MLLKRPPEIIYKYCNADIAKTILSDGTFNYQNPSAFNDPLDCYEELIDWTLTDKGIEVIMERNYSNESRNERRKIISEIKKANSKIVEIYKQGIIKKKESLGICCFSKNYNNVLMWSHYASKHTGLCIGYSPPINWPKDYVCLEVDYPEIIIKKNFHEDIEIVLQYWILTKALDWKYEEEVREIYFNEDGIKSFPPKSLKKIVFGCNASEKFIKDIFKIIKEKQYMHISDFSGMDIDSRTLSLREIPTPFNISLPFD